jgi:hypothetical protein
MEVLHLEVNPNGERSTKMEAPTVSDVHGPRWQAGSARKSADDVTLYLNGGNQGLQFAALGSVVYERANAAGLGRNLPTEWFLQDIRD